MSEVLSHRTEALLRRLVRRDASTALNKVVARSRPEDVAAAMEHLTLAEMRRLHGMIADRQLAADVLAHLSDASRDELARELPTDVLRDLVDRMEPDDATDVIGGLDQDRRDELLEELEDDPTGEEVRELLTWPADSAGGLMAPNAFMVPHDATCSDAIAALMARHERIESIYYVYVVDAARRLIGVTSLRSLLTTPPMTRVSDVMSRQVITVGPRTDQEEVARYVARYDLFAIPVVDEGRRILGVVTVDDVVDVLREEAAEDMMRMAGVPDGAVDRVGVATQARNRSKWLFAALASGVLAAELISFYETSIARAAILAGFIPMVMGVGGNVGIQTATLTVRGLATGAVDASNAGRFVTREVAIACLLGVGFASLLGMYAGLRFGDASAVGVVVALSIAVAVTLAGAVGAMIPLGFARAGVDPAIATGPFVTSSLDLLGIVVFFNVARALLGP